MTSEEDELQGIITVKDLATANMDLFDTGILASSRTSFRNILETLGGTMAVGSADAICTTGHIKIGTATPEMLESTVEKGDIVILTNRYESQLCAIEKEAVPAHPVQQRQGGPHHPAHCRGDRRCHHDHPGG